MRSGVLEPLYTGGGATAVRKAIGTALGLSLAFRATAQPYPAVWIKPEIQSIQSNIDVSADGTLVSTGGAKVRLLRSPQMTQVLERPGFVNNTCAALTRDGQLLAASPVDATGTIQVIRVSDGATVNTLTGFTGTANGLEFSNDGQYLAAVLNNVRIVVWRMSDNALVRTFEIPGVVEVEWMPDHSILTAQGNDRIEQRSLGTGSTLRSYISPGRQLKCLDLNPSGSRFVMSDAFDVFSVDTDSGVASLIIGEPHGQLGISDDGSTAFTNPASIRAFDIASKQLIWTAIVGESVAQFKVVASRIVAKGTRVWPVDVSDGRVLGSSGLFQSDWGYVNRTVQICSTITESYKMGDGSTWVAGVSTSGGGTVSPGGTKTMTIGFSSNYVDLVTGQLIWQGAQFFDVSTSAFTMDGSIVVPGIGVETRPSAPHVYATSTGSLLRTLADLGTASVRFSPNDQYLLVAGSEARLYRTSDYSAVWSFPRRGYPASSMFCDRGHQILLRGEDEMLAVRTSDGTITRRIPMPQSFSMVAGADGEVVGQNSGRFFRFYRMKDGALLREFVPPVDASQIRAVGSEDGRYIWAVSSSGGALLKNPYYMEGNSPVDAFTVEKGKQLSGGLADLIQPDGSKVVVSSNGNGKIVLLLQGQSAMRNPGTLFARLVASPATAGIKATFELFDFQSQQYSETSEILMNLNDDSYVNVVPLNHTRFLDSSGRLRARVTFTPTQPVLRDWTVSLDQFAWQAAE